MENNTRINKGDRIEVTAPDRDYGYPVTKTGRVVTAVDWGDENRSDWYIEFAEDGNNLTVYVKEQYDKATIRKLNGG